jgi:lipid II:glycine glycyltransferase (peptidoglycan interpeptide bridge formation enzyme)
MLESTFHLSTNAWDRFVTAFPGAHILQTSPWGTLKSKFGWTTERVGLAYADNDARDDVKLVAGAQVLFRRLPAGLGRLAYVPEGPLLDWANAEQTRALLSTLDRAARAHRAIALTLEPDLPDEPTHREQLQTLGLGPSPLDSIQPRRTIAVDIAPDEDAILAAMKQKTRYNVRLAGRKGVTVHQATEADLPAFHALMAATGERGEFGVHAPAYYKAAYRLFVPRGWAQLLLAKVEKEPVAAVMAFALPPRAWYFYGASGNAHREKMAPYLLQWEAMRWAKSLGCTTYDLYGVPDQDEEALESEFTQRRDGLWGVYRFKRGFGGKLTRSVGAWDHVYAPLRYRLYCWLLTLRGQILTR